MKTKTLAVGALRLSTGKDRFDGWGARKLRQVLRTRYSPRAWLVRSTVNDILDRQSLPKKNRARRRSAIGGTRAAH